MPENATASPQKTGNRWRRRALWALALWLTTCALGWLALPPVLKWQLETRGTAALGRAVTVDSVDFRPWSLELALTGLRVGPATGAPADSPALLTAQRLYIDAELQSLLRLAPVVDALVLEQPQVHLAHLGAGRYSIDDVLAKLATPDDTASTPPRFAVYNIRIQGGAVDFDDQPAGARHRLRQLELHIPFLSNLASRREVATTPKLAFVLNDSAFETTATATPFAKHPKTEVHFQLPALALAPYLPYWPAQWPLRPAAGQLEANLTLGFEQQDTPKVRLSGQVAVSQLAVIENPAQPRPLFGWERLALDVAELLPLERQLKLNAVTWTRPNWYVRRSSDGTLNWARLLDQLTTGSPSGPPAGPAAAPTPPWQVAVQALDLTQGLVQWQDATTQPQAQLALEDLNLHVGPLQWPSGPDTPFDAQARLGQTPLRAKGQGGPAGAQVVLTWADAPLALAQPYVAQVLQHPVQGKLGGELQLTWTAATPEKTGGLQIDAPTLALSGFKLGDPQKPQVAWSELALKNLALDWSAQRVKLGQLALTQPQLVLERNTDGRWAFDTWLRPSNAAPSPQPTPPAPTPAVWHAQLDRLLVQNGSGQFLDRSTERPVRLAWQGLNLQVQNLQPLATQPPTSAVSVSTRLLGLRGEPGQLRFEGALRLPDHNGMGTQVKGQLGLERMPLHTIEPYLAPHLNLDLVRADLGYQGHIAVEAPSGGLSLQLQGQAALDDLRASTLNPSEELLDWKSLQLRGLQVVLQGGQLTRLQIAETVLSDYYARVVIDNTGRINLQNLVNTPSAPQAAGAVGAPVTSAPTPASPPPSVQMGPTTLVNGRVYFSDRFIKPNYSANLSELTGRLGAFSNQTPVGTAPPAMAELDLRGRAEGTASLQINGRLNPLATPLALDIKGVVRELELPPLSPYSVKYAGYGIERGKLSVDVAYKIAPNGQLEASNQIVLNQLRFGDRVPGSEAPNLPVKLAVALLADRNGVIDINLPVSGSLNDPAFSVGPIVFKLVLNLIGKAITSPFALIASALGGGGEDLQQVPFPAGRAVLDSAGQQRLERVAKALLDRPNLQLTATGHSDASTERDGYRQARLEAMVWAEKRRRDAQTGAGADTATPPTPDEYPALLKAVYRRADITKPRNALGLTKDLPVPDMEALLLASIPVAPDAMRDLAVARAVAVKDHLARLQVPLDRLFLGAPVVGQGGHPHGADLKLEPR
jgi:uncharacterized protein involved in outer membrane biogenesis